MIFDYNFNYPTYKNYVKMIEKLSNKYNKTYTNLYKKYIQELNNYNESKYKKVLKRKKKIDIKYIKKIIHKFSKLLKKEKTIIFFHGSYSKNLNRWNSDIDINFLYLENNKENFVLEEIIVCAIYKILNLKGRDKVHTMMIYLPNIKESEYNLTEEYSIRFKNNELYKYKCRKNFRSIYPKIINSSRNFKDFKIYIKDSGYFEEWIYSYEGLRKKDKSIINKVLKEKDENLKQESTSFFTFINNYKENLKNTTTNDIKTVSKLNKKLKINNLNKIYTMLLILKEFIVINGGKCNSIDIYRIKNNKLIYKLINKNLLNDLFKHIYEYIYFIDRIENLFVELNINFSSREMTKINMKEIKKNYKEYYNSDFRKDYESYRNFINSSKKIIRRIESYGK